MGLIASLDAAALWRAVSLMVLVWLAYFFGRTLRNGETPLIERFARVSTPKMTPALCRYTRLLTGIWCGYFLVAAGVSLASNFAPVWSGLCIWLGSATLFIGEHRLRPKFFPGQEFPSLVQQIKDTRYVWHKK